MKKQRYILNRLILLIVISFVIFSYEAQAKIKIGKWKTLFPAIQHATGEADKDEPRLQKVNALKIDTHCRGIRFYTTPSNGPLPKETISQTTGDFLLEHKLQVAINANFFRPCCNKVPEPKDLRGLAISEGKIVSPPVSELGVRFSPALLITKDNRCTLKNTSRSTDLSNIWTAVAGSFWLVRDGKNVSSEIKPETKAVHPRTAVGLSKDNRYLIMITNDGRQKGYSEGATYKETADWLIRFGAYNGINLDGGGSTTMVADDGKGGYILLNRPIAGAGVGHKGTPGQQRLNGNSLGVYSRCKCKEAHRCATQSSTQSTNKSSCSSCRCKCWPCCPKNKKQLKQQKQSKVLISKSAPTRAG